MPDPTEPGSTSRRPASIRPRPPLRPRPCPRPMRARRRLGSRSSTRGRSSTAGATRRTGPSAMSARPRRTSSPPGSTRSGPCSATAAAPAQAKRDIALGAELLAAVERHADRFDATAIERPLEIEVERERARFGSWYELFPRSWGGFEGVRRRLPELAELGFDVVYLT